MDSFQAQEQIQRILSSILPQIGREIAQKYRSDTLEKRTAAYQAQQQKLQEQAFEQYLQLSNVIKVEHTKALAKQKQEFERQLYEISLMSTDRERIDEIKYEQFKEKMKESNIQDLIIQSNLVASLQEQISQSLEEKYRAKLEQDLTNYTKQMTYNSSRKLKIQLQTEKKQIQSKIQNIGLSLKKQVQVQKTSLATLRSKSNIIIKKLTLQKQQYLKKYQTQSLQKQQLYQQLLIRYKQLQKQAIESAGVHLKNSLNDYPFNYKQESNSSNTLFELISEASSDKEMSPSQDLSVHSSAYETHFQTVQIPYSRILDMDIKKYTSNENQSENKSMNELSSYLSKGEKEREKDHKKESKFSQQYCKELDKLNKKNKLSAVAKSLIVDTLIRKGKEGQFKFVNLR